MATTLTRTEPFIDWVLYKWASLANGEAGDSQAQVLSGDRVAQVTGTLGAGGTLIIEGSLDGTNWFQLHDPANVLISFTAAGGKAIMEATPYVRPRVTAGDGTTALTCQICNRRN